ncbi:MAG: ADP-ribosylation factor-like protein [Promethearchaeota archaeon]
MGIFSFMTRKVKNKSIFCGLDSSGKSTIISFLQEGRFVEHVPTMGKDMTEMEVQGIRLNLFDMGGQSHFRQMWLGELDNTKCVVFVIDKADPARFPEAKAELEKLLPVIEKKKIKLLIFANKHDISKDVPLSKIISDFELDKLSNFELLEISAKTGYGMTDAFVKFYSILTGQVIKKNAVASAISIYSNGGIPLITQAKNEAEVDKNILEGGFLSAITAFAEMKVNNSVIKFESENNGTFLILKSQNFIGALLWNDQLDIPMDVSEEALKELLNHLESIQVYKKPEEVPDVVEQYVTNMM